LGINRDTLRGWVKQAQIDAGSRLITGWRTAKSMTTDLVLDALEMGIGQRRRQGHSLRGWSTILTPVSQYTSIRYTERVAEAGARRSIGSVGDSYDKP
jgi:putative transposase